MYLHFVALVFMLVLEMLLFGIFEVLLHEGEVRVCLLELLLAVG
jgi:hypothetical protein